MDKSTFYLYILLFFCYITLHSQTKKDSLLINKEFFSNIKVLNFKNAKRISELSTRKDLKLIYNLYATKLKKNTTLDFKYNSAISYLIEGLKVNNNSNKKREVAYASFLKALNLTDNKNLELRKFVLRNILDVYVQGTLQSDNDFEYYLKLYKSVCSDKYDYLYYYSYLFRLRGQTEIYNENNSKNQNDYDKIFKKYDSVVENNKFGKILVFYFKDKSNFIIRNNPELAKSYSYKQINFCDSLDFYRNFKYLAYTNLSRASSLLNKHYQGLQFLDTAKLYINKRHSLKNNLALTIYKANHFAKLKKYDSAYYLAEKIRKLGYLHNFQKHNTEISKVKLELNTEKKEKENLQLKANNLEIESKRKQNLNLLIATILILIAGTTIYLLSFKNSKRKRKVALQEKEIEQQKNLALLKEQEINTINAMIDGQEKERVRIAEDLHDNIGSVLSTLKLHFENLKLNRDKKHFNQDELYQKTENLIDETYLKVRKIAHAKNSGVIANQGLLIAVQNMADKISAADNIKIEVTEFGLEKRIENNIEITIFRIIQELVTNIVKHANATNASINISLFDKNLNVIVEDDGTGFSKKKIKVKEGMGLSSIKKRVKHLKGTLKIDSFINKGTTIIIDIPV